MSTVPVVAPSRLALPRLRKNEVRARNLIADLARDRPVLLSGSPWLITLEPWTAGAPPLVPSADSWLICLLWAGAQVKIHLPATVCQTWMAMAFPDLSLPDLSDAFAASALESALGEVLEAGLLTQRGALQLTALERSPDPSPNLAHRFGLLLRQGSQLIHGSLATDNLGLMLMAGLVKDLFESGSAESPNSNTQGMSDDLPIMLQAEIGRSTLGLSELERLEPGDTVLLGQCWIFQDAGLWLGWESVGLRAAYEDSRLIVTQLLGEEGVLMSTDALAQESQAVALSEVPVRLTFDLGERTLSLGELKSLHVGQVLELNRPLDQAVTIRVNGARIGTGELLEIDGQLGVTIVQWSASQRGAPEQAPR